MNKESLLKKEFNQRDVQRMRNLISKNYGDKTRIQAGYEKQKENHQEGDVWEENGKTWTLKNGIKQSITKFDTFKKLTVLPLSCPKCNKAMKASSINKKMYSIHGMCFECVLKMEIKLREKGLFEEYEKKFMNANKNSMVDDLEIALNAWVDDKETYVTEQGDIENWSESSSKQKAVDEAKEVLKKIRDVEL